MVNFHYDYVNYRFHRGQGVIEQPAGTLLSLFKVFANENDVHIHNTSPRKHTWLSRYSVLFLITAILTFCISQNLVLTLLLTRTIFTRMSWLNYHHLTYFWTVVRKGGLAPAAEELHLSPSTVSTQIQQLEHVLGYKLFDRSGRQLVMNDAGQIVYRYAEEIFSLGRELQDVLEDRPFERPIRVQIGLADVIPKLVAAKLLAPVLDSPQRFHLVCREDHPDNLVSQLILHDLDMVITDARISPDLRVRGFNHLLGESEVSVFSSSRLATRCKKGFPQSLDGAPCILPGDRTELRRSLERWFESHKIRPKVVAECDDSALIKALGQASIGFFVAPSVAGSEIVRQYRVREVGRLEGVVERFYAISMDRRIKHPAVQAIVDYAKSEVFRD